MCLPEEGLIAFNTDSAHAPDKEGTRTFFPLGFDIDQAAKNSPTFVGATAKRVSFFFVFLHRRAGMFLSVNMVPNERESLHFLHFRSL